MLSGADAEVLAHQNTIRIQTIRIQTKSKEYKKVWCMSLLKDKNSSPSDAERARRSPMQQTQQLTLTFGLCLRYTYYFRYTIFSA